MTDFERVREINKRVKAARKILREAKRRFLKLPKWEREWYENEYGRFRGTSK